MSNLIRSTHISGSSVGGFRSVRRPSDRGFDSGVIVAGRYRIVEELGSGGQARVYLAEQRFGSATRLVAVKVLSRIAAGNPVLRRRFERECEILTELTHPNTVRCYDSGVLEDGTMYTVLEHVRGRSVADLVRQGAVDLATAQSILRQVCGSLGEAHAHGIIHRDLKPENLLLTRFTGGLELVKVLDFGIAHLDHSPTHLTRPDGILGSPAYMSPEQFYGGAIDHRSDVYALGVLAYHLLTGELPFVAESLFGWANQHSHGVPAPFEEYAHTRDLPTPCKMAIMRALAKNPAHRPGSVEDFYAEFSGDAAKLPLRTLNMVALSPLSPVVTSIPPMVETRRMPRWPRWTAAAAFLLGASAVVTSTQIGAQRFTGPEVLATALEFEATESPKADLPAAFAPGEDKESTDFAVEESVPFASAEPARVAARAPVRQRGESSSRQTPPALEPDLPARVAESEPETEPEQIEPESSDQAGPQPPPFDRIPPELLAALEDIRRNGPRGDLQEAVIPEIHQWMQALERDPRSRHRNQRRVGPRGPIRVVAEP